MRSGILRSSAGAALCVGACAYAPSGHAQRAWETPGEREATEARALADAGRCRAALDWFDRAVDQRPRDGELRRDRGRCHDKLENPRPAIEDYRAYLSLEPRASDRLQIERRLSTLESAHLPKSKAPDHDGDGRVEKTKTPEDLEDPFAIDENPEATNESRVVEVGPSFLPGLYLGWRDWNEKGFAEPTVSVGALVAFDYTPGNEVALRAAYLKTGSGGGLGDASGFEISGFYALIFELDSGGALDLVLGVGAGLELQKTELKTNTSFVTGRAWPAVRWNASEALVLQGGPEVGVGILGRGARQDADETSDVAVYYGLGATLSWKIGGASSPPEGDDAVEAPNPDEPLDEQELWDE